MTLESGLLGARFNQLKEMLCESYQIESCKLFYFDDENDYCRIACDAEWKECVSLCDSGQVLKLFIEPSCRPTMHMLKTFGVLCKTLSMKHAFDYLESRGVCVTSAREMAGVFLSARDAQLDIGNVLMNFFAQKEKFNNECLQEFCVLLQLKGKAHDEALRMFCTHVKINGEAQQIDRVIETFGKVYSDENPQSMPDAAYLLAYSMLMLNTDLHSDAIRRKMTKLEYIRSLRGIHNLSESAIGDIYDSILKEPLV